MIGHDYAVVIRRLRSEEGGGYLATIPQLGGGSFNGVGETTEAALRNLAELYDYLRPRLEAEGHEFPLPLDERQIGALIHDKH